MCLKLSWTTDEVLRNAHFDNKRKFDLYTALDQSERLRPIMALPIIDNDTFQRVQDRYQGSLEQVMKLMGLVIKAHKISPEDELKMRNILQRIVGPDLKSAEEWVDLNKPAKEPPPRMD